MKRKLIKIFRSFQARILFAFSAFIGIILTWVCIYFFINSKQKHLNSFSYHLTQLQSEYSESNSNLDYFILTGYHQPSFYDSGKQKNIDVFLSEQIQIMNNLEQIKDESSYNHIAINDEVNTLIKLHSALLDSVKVLKTVYFYKGFKDWGIEGTMRNYAHYLENNGSLQKTDLLTLRRHEKDFLLRQEPKYVTEFNALIDSQITKYAAVPPTLNALTEYKKNFNNLVYYTQRLSINDETGLYGHVQHIVGELRKQYLLIDADVAKKTAGLDNIFSGILIAVTLAPLAGAILLSIVISNYLTKDILQLSKNVTLYIRSKFKDTENQMEPLSSRITEIERLNNNFLFLKQTLRSTLNNLENAVKDEQQAKASLEVTIAKLNEHMAAIEEQKNEIENSEAKLNAFFNSSTSCHIMVGNDLHIMAFNKAAVTFIKDLNGKELIKGGYILLFLNETYIDTFIDDYKKALSGEVIREERQIDYGGGSVWWEISFVPAFDRAGNIFAISFNATNIHESKTHSNKIKTQNEVLLKIAHVQSHEVRGPIATIMGIMNLIREEENFSKEYLALLEEAVQAFDKKIHAIVDYTKQVW